MRKGGLFNGKVVDDADVCRYDGSTDITIAASSHPHGTSILYREVEPMGNLLAVHRPNVRNHGLSRLQVGISLPGDHGVCHFVTPTPRATRFNAVGERVIDVAAYREWSHLQLQGRHDEASKLFRLEPVPTELEVRENLAVVALDGDVTDKGLVETVASMLSQGDVDKYPHADRGPRIISEALTNLEDSMLDGLEPEELEVMADLAEKQGQYGPAVFIRRHLESGLPLPQQQAVMREIRRLTDAYQELERQLQYAQEWEREDEVAAISAKMTENDAALAVQVKLQYRLSDAMKGVPPVEPLNWGVPSSVFAAYAYPAKSLVHARRQFAGFVRSLNLTCVQVADMALEEYGTDIPLLRAKGQRELTYDLLSQVIWNSEQGYARLLEGWSNGSDAASRAQNMGDMVASLGEFTDELDARPRASFSDEPVAEMVLGEFEEEALKRDLTRKTTPRDEQVWMGELTPFSSDVPFVNTEDGFAGHPMAWLIQQTLDAMGTDVDESLGEVTRLLGVTYDAKVDGKWLTEVNGVVGTVLAIDGIEHVVQFPHEPQEHGYLYQVQRDDRWAIGAENPNTLEDIQADDYVGFAHRLAFLEWRAALTQFPTIAVEDGRAIIAERESGAFIEVNYLPLAQVFPKLVEFISWAKNAMDDGETGLDTEMTGALWSLQQELSDYQNRMMSLLVQANLDEHFSEFTEELESAWSMWVQDPDVGLARGEFKSPDGVPTSLYGRLSMILWASQTALTEETIVIPRPAKLAGTYLSEDSGEEVNVWGVNETLLWRIMGYSLNTQRFRHGLGGITQMVKELIVRPNPMDLVQRTEWFRNPITGRSYRKMVTKRLVTWTDTGNWSVGVLGDALADWWQSAIGLHSSAVKGNILAMSKDELREKLGWDPQTIRKVAALGQSWGRSKELRNSSFERFVEILLPMPTMTAENFQKCQQVMKKRLQLVSPAPKLTGELFDQAMELLEANDRQVKAFLALVRSGVDEIGPDVVRGLAEILS